LFAFANGKTIPGWASLSSLLFLLFGILFILLGIIGTYLAEVWRRTSGIPDYFVGRVTVDPYNNAKEM